jgi:thioester reductase-like protein
VHVLEGDVADIDLGLGGGEYRALIAELTAIYHAGNVRNPAGKKAVLERANVQGTRMLLDVAKECSRLRRLLHWSTCEVAGTRSGVILEEELESGQRFGNASAETQYRAECLVREAARRLPTTVVRPGIIVGDSRTGEIDRLDGLYYLLVLIISSPLGVRLPLPAGAEPLNLVPINFAVDAALELAKDPSAQGKTFHLTDPCPLSARSVFELVAKHADRKAPRDSLSGRLALRFSARMVAPLFGAPGSSKMIDSLIESISHFSLYNCKNTLQHLKDTGIECPPFDTYVDQLVKFLRESQDLRKVEDGPDDALE